MTINELKRLCEQRQIVITRTGAAYRLTGRGVNLLVANLGCVTRADLLPHRPPNSERATLPD